MSEVLLTPPNTLPPIEQIWIFVSRDRETGCEGVCGFQELDGQWMPLMLNDPKLLPLLRNTAARIAQQSGMTVKLLRFSHREEVEVIEP